MAMSGWLTKAGPFPVEHVPCPVPGDKVTLSVPRKVVQHTTEGSTIEGALAVFREHYAPTFTVGRDSKRRARILQHAPIGRMAAALQNKPGGVETNREVLAQIELVGFSKRTEWLPDLLVTRMLAALYSELERRWNIPLRHVNNPTRSTRNWMIYAGVYGHCDVPENDHWDPGNLSWGTIWKFAREYSDPPEGLVVQPKRIVAPKTLAMRRLARKRLKGQQLPPGEVLT